MCVHEENHAAFRETLTVSSFPRAYLWSRLGVQTSSRGWHGQGSRSQLDQGPLLKTFRAVIWNGRPLAVALVLGTKVNAKVKEGIWVGQ